MGEQEDEASACGLSSLGGEFLKGSSCGPQRKTSGEPLALGNMQWELFSSDSPVTSLRSQVPELSTTGVLILIAAAPWGSGSAPCSVGCLTMLFPNSVLQMQKLRLKDILICPPLVTRLAHSRSVPHAHPSPHSAPSDWPSLSQVRRHGLNTAKPAQEHSCLPRALRMGRTQWLGIIRPWEGGGRRFPNVLGFKQFPKGAGAACPKIWRQKSEFVLKSTKKKAPC